MPIEVMSDGTPVSYVGKEAVNFFRMRTLLHGMRAELKGIRLTRKAPSCFTIVKREYGLKGNKEKLIEQFKQLVDRENAKMEYTNERP